MNQITLRVDDECIAFVRHHARERKSAEAPVWRELLYLGIHRSDDVLFLLEQLSKLVAQDLCMSQTLAHHHDPNLVEQARNDARLLLARMAAMRESGNED